MRDLAARLREIVRQDREAQARTAPAPHELTYVADLGEADTGDSVERAAAGLGGTIHEVDGSSCVVVDRVWEGTDWHGRRQVSSYGLDPAAPLGLFDPHAGAVSNWPSRVVFFDVETTGLSGGAGTLAFLAGCGWFEDAGFRVRQFFISAASGERALLDALGSVFREASLLVTFNGRTFDVPLMETRWAFHRAACPTDGRPHFDMLPPARRLWGRRGNGNDSGSRFLANHGETTPGVVSSCSLSSLERSVLGFHRLGDVPGFEIPARYFQFLRTGDAGLMQGVLEHNRHDLISLAAVMSHALWLAREGPEACRGAGEQLGLGRLYERAGDVDRALLAYELAARHQDGDGERDVRRHALARLAVLMRREDRHEEAAAAWQGLLALAGGLRSASGALERRAAEALAVHHEHRARDLASARRYAETLRADATGRARADADHRLVRIDRKLKASEQAPAVGLNWEGET